MGVEKHAHAHTNIYHVEKPSCFCFKVSILTEKCEVWLFFPRNQLVSVQVRSGCHFKAWTFYFLVIPSTSYDVLITTSFYIYKVYIFTTLLLNNFVIGIVSTTYNWFMNSKSWRSNLMSSINRQLWKSPRFKRLTEIAIACSGYY